MKEQQVKLEIAATDLDRVVAADKAEIASEFDKEILQALDETVVKAGFGMVRRQVRKFDEKAVLEDGSGGRV